MPRLVVPFRKVTEPVGTPVPDWSATVAVKATLWPAVACVGDAVSVVAVATSDLDTFTVTAAETEPASLLSPP